MKVLEVVAAIIISNKHIFACQRGDHKYIAYKYEFPGGKVEEDEHHIDALKREIQEELKTKVKVERYFMSVSYEYPTFIVNLHTYLCHVEEGNLELTEHINSQWLNKNTVYSVSWAEADYPIIEQLIKENVI